MGSRDPISPAPDRATVVSATPGKGTAAPALGSGPGRHPLADWVKLHAGRKAKMAETVLATKKNSDLPGDSANMKTSSRDDVSPGAEGQPADPFAGDAAPEWYDDYRGLRNRADSGGKLSPAEQKQLDDLEKRIRQLSGMAPGTYRAPGSEQTPGDWWGTLTYQERATVCNSANYRKWARGLRGTAARTGYGRDAALDEFIGKVVESHRGRTVRT